MPLFHHAPLSVFYVARCFRTIMPDSSTCVAYYIHNKPENNANIAITGISALISITMLTPSISKEGQCVNLGKKFLDKSCHGRINIFSLKFLEKWQGICRNGWQVSPEYTRGYNELYFQHLSPSHRSGCHRYFHSGISSFYPRTCFSEHKMKGIGL
jgi:hypothetical protein